MYRVPDTLIWHCTSVHCMLVMRPTNDNCNTVVPISGGASYWAKGLKPTQNAVVVAPAIGLRGSSSPKTQWWYQLLG